MMRIPGVLVQQARDAHTIYWSRRLRPILQRLLLLANYHDSDINDQLQFLDYCISPHLGNRPLPFGRQSWHSFMTDDGTPVELSWSWTESNVNIVPTVRYSIEPIARPTTSSCTRSPNLRGNDSFVRDASSWCSALDLTWYTRLSDILLQSEQPHTSSPGTPRSQIFWAFDLYGCERLLKVYYVLDPRAQSLNCTKLSLANRALCKLGLDLDSTMMKAVQSFFARLMALGPDVDVEMLGFDCIDPSRSRIKIYFRSQDTSFNSVRRIMSWSQSDSATMDAGMRSLNSLWAAILGLDSQKPADEPLEEKNHRTAGILYYCEFKMYSSAFRIKIYIPVRHYGRSDYEIAEGVSKILGEMGLGFDGLTYLDALGELKSQRALKKGVGLHTYISCAINSKGNLDITTYLNPGKISAKGRWSKWLYGGGK